MFYLYRFFCLSVSLFAALLNYSVCFIAVFYWPCISVWTCVQTFV